EPRRTAQNRTEPAGVAIVDQAFDRPGTEPCAKWTLGGLTRTGLLLMGAALACISSVDLPNPTGWAAGGQGAAQPYVPASGDWLELGLSGAPDASPRRDPLAAEILQHTAAAEPGVEPRQEAQRRPDGRPAG
ncbi:MAG: hypothetical protein J2P50_14125, partial [Hyphomicrobiaceae bacterium]|nr:hypothetical protein [Hyphomicrobiaceae bacterium]